MRKVFILFLFFIVIPIYSFALSDSDIYSQETISGIFLESGYADTTLLKNARNVVIDILSRDIISYILNNTDEKIAKTLSTNLPENIQKCDDEYLVNMNSGMGIDNADNILFSCREEVYSKNLSYIIKETATIQDGKNYKLLKNIFKDYTEEFINIEPFNIDEFINKMAVYNLITLNGKPAYNSFSNMKEEKLKCENNHTQLKIIDEASEKEISDININGRDFKVVACLNRNTNSYFKYVLLYLKDNERYNLYERLPIFLNFYNSQNFGYEKEDIVVNVDQTLLTIKDKLDSETSLIFNYMMFRKGTYLSSFIINNKEGSHYVFRDTSEDKYLVAPYNISLKLYKSMVDEYCKSNSKGCKSMEIDKVLSISSVGY